MTRFQISQSASIALSAAFVLVTGLPTLAIPATA